MLHSTGHIRTLKENFPHSKITVLTADTSYDIFKHNDKVEKIILFEKDRVKREWKSNLKWAVGHILSLIGEVRTRQYDLAFGPPGKIQVP